MFIDGNASTSLKIKKNQDTTISIYDIKDDYTIECYGKGIIFLYLFPEYGKSATIYIYGKNVKYQIQGDIKIHRLLQKPH